MECVMVIGNGLEKMGQKCVLAMSRCLLRIVYLEHPKVLNLLEGLFDFDKGKQIGKWTTYDIENCAG